MNIDEALKTINQFIENDLEKDIAEVDALTCQAKTACLEYRKLFRADYGMIEGEISDQMLGVPIPAYEKPFPEGAELIDLPSPNKEILKKTNLFDCIIERESRRKFTNESLSLSELSLLCFTTQGLRGKPAAGRWHFRTVPSGGARHPYETYLAVNKVEGLDSGIYRYLPLEHKLLLVKAVDEKELRKKMTHYSEGQEFAGQSAVVFIWSCVPYRMEWRYSTMARRDLLLEAGHICQNLYLCVEGLGLGTCSILAYRQDLDDYLGLDGVDEFVTYISPVGRIEK
ncbi:MAG: SagB/ThcOx family dehydrogenase [Candidatus Cloacimonetes bacterium]|nr:SagB/ThcOx family dehydrogenase [Candidatus Cloacimonadota bacterium]